ncbi:hypothetical protein T265_00943 [Opisthorchis viverrini]|uniref:Uncharacterized protein n=1 Tax=Opisthorchis viverrini TaxID=6198 RepID=A0A075A426_OPIVI|nr:hypothetical protein T265_00943 [Opisthorchis viverrini]KER33032.1 hypothetical protein T265_00943 [Opisthorchis viverrini]
MLSRSPICVLRRSDRYSADNKRTDALRPLGCASYIRGGARWPKWLEREFTNRKVRGSNPTSATRLPLSRLGQPGSIPALLLPSGGMAARHRKGATAERFLSFFRTYGTPHKSKKASGTKNQNVGAQPH